MISFVSAIHIYSEIGTAPFTKLVCVWGFCCGDGWYDIINHLCAEISNQVDSGTMPPVVASQVKEKFGSLRFHFRGGNNETRRLVELARLESERICEQCGRAEPSSHAC